MKNILFILLVLFTLSCQKKQTFVHTKPVPSKIDSLSTAADIEAYIKETDSLYDGFRIKKFASIDTILDIKTDSIMKRYLSQLKIDKPFYKEDFNNDGLKDLLLYGTWGESKGLETRADIMIIINGGDKNARMHVLGKTDHTVFVPEIRKTDSLPLIVLHQPRRIDNQYPRAKDSAQVKLIYRSGRFVEYNNKPARHKILKIQYRADPCFGTCPQFEMILERGKDSWFIAQSNNFKKIGILDPAPAREEGTFKTMMSDADFTALESLLNYIDFVNLHNSYVVLYTNSPSAHMIITYDDGKVKRITDSGQNGTYGLLAFYQRMMDLRFTEKWEKTKEPQEIRMKQFWN